MGKLKLYTNGFDRNDIEKLSCMEGYEIHKYEFTSSLPEFIDENESILAVIYHPEEVENLWRWINGIKDIHAPVSVLLILDKEDFSIAYEASKYSYVQLLLQSEDEEGWNRCVKVCLEHISYMKRFMEDRAQLEAYEFQKNYKMKERLLANILDKPEQVEFLLPEINQRYGTDFGEGEYQVLIVQVDKPELSAPPPHFIKEVILRTLRTLSFTKETVMGFREPYGMVGVLHFSKDVNPSERDGDMKRLIQSITQLKDKYGEFRVTLAVGRAVDSISQIIESMKGAALAKEYRIMTEKAVIYAGDMKNIDQDMKHYLPERKRKELIRYITLGDVRHVNRWFLEFHQNLEPKFLNYPPAFAYMCWGIYRDLANHEKTSKIQVFSEWKFFSLQHIFDMQERIQELEILLLEICHMIAEGMEEEQDVAVKAIAYMKVHFKEPINLEFIAEKCGLSTSYFSRKFKEQTGTNYIEVLTDIRIREAQKLLGTTDMSIAEIIEEVGYCDDKHFRKLFFKITGMKPMEYRKKIRKDKNFQ